MNKDKRRCECKELIDTGVCDEGYVWNPSNCECECDKSCNISQYLNYLDCKYRKKLIDPLIEECTENNDETKLVNITLTENENNYQHSSCKVYIVLMTVNFTIFTGIIIYFVYYNWSFIKNKVFCIKSIVHEKTIIW